MLMRFLAYLAGGTLVALLLSLALLSRSPDYNDCIAHDGRHATGHYDANNKPIIDPAIASPTSVNLFFHCGGYFATENGNGITAVFTTLLAAITVMLAYLAWNQSYATRTQLRSYVSPRIKRVKKFSLTEPIVIEIGLKNVGQTPAKKFEAHAVVFFGALPLADNAKFPRPRKGTLARHGKGTLYPGSDQSIDGEAEFSLSSEIIARLKEKKPKIAIYVAGKAHYRDIFGTKHVTQFCSYIDSSDAVLLIEAEEKNSELVDVEIRFSQSHACNKST